LEGLVVKHMLFVVLFATVLTCFNPICATVEKEYNKQFGIFTFFKDVKDRKRPILSPVMCLGAAAVCAVISMLLRVVDKGFERDLTDRTDLLLFGGFRTVAIASMITSLSFATASMLASFRFIMDQVLKKGRRGSSKQLF